jgi:hypothetical protein
MELGETSSEFDWSSRFHGDKRFLGIKRPHNSTSWVLFHFLLPVSMDQALSDTIHRSVSKCPGTTFCNIFHILRRLRVFSRKSISFINFFELLISCLPTSLYKLNLRVLLTEVNVFVEVLTTLRWDKLGWTSDLFVELTLHWAGVTRTRELKPLLDKLIYFQVGVISFSGWFDEGLQSNA